MPDPESAPLPVREKQPQSSREGRTPVSTPKSPHISTLSKHASKHSPRSSHAVLTPESPAVPVVKQHVPPRSVGASRAVPPPSAGRLSPPLPALLRPAVDPREVTAGPYDIPPPSRPVPRQRSLLTARPNRSPTPHRPGSQTPAGDLPRALTPAQDHPRSLTPVTECPRRLTPITECPRSLTPLSERSRSLTPISSDVRSAAPEVRGQGQSHRSRTPAGDGHCQGVDGYRGVRQWTQVVSGFGGRLSSPLPPIGDRQGRPRTRGGALNHSDVTSARSSAVSTGGWEGSAARNVDDSRCDNREREDSDEREVHGKRLTKRPMEVVHLQPERSTAQERLYTSRNSVSEKPKMATDTESSLLASTTSWHHESLQIQTDSDLKRRTVVLRARGPNSPADLSPEKRKSSADLEDRLCPVKSGHDHQPPHLFNPSPTSPRSHQAARQSHTSDHPEPISSPSVSDPVRRAPVPVRGMRSHIPVSTRRRAGAATVSPRARAVATGTAEVIPIAAETSRVTEVTEVTPPRVTEVTERPVTPPRVTEVTEGPVTPPRVTEVTEGPVTPPRVTGRRRWDQAGTDPAREETDTRGTGPGRRPPPITPRKRLFISLSSETETVLTERRHDVLSSGTVGEKPKDSPTAAVGENRVSGEPQSCSSPVRSGNFVTTVRRQQNDTPSHNSPEHIVPSSASCPPEPVRSPPVSTPPFDRPPGSDSSPSLPEQIHRPHPRPAAPSPQRPPGQQQRSPVPTPRLSRGDLRLRRSERPALRRLQLVRRTLEREHDVLSSALADKAAALDDRSAAAGAF